MLSRVDQEGYSELYTEVQTNTMMQRAAKAENTVRLQDATYTGRTPCNTLTSLKPWVPAARDRVSRPLL